MAVTARPRRPQPPVSSQRLLAWHDAGRLRLAVLQPGMPSTRAECESGPRPCPWIRCRHHAWLVTDRPGMRRPGRPGPPPLVMEHTGETCALDVAARGPQSYDAIARVMGLKPTRARQVAEMAARKFHAAMLEWHDETFGAGEACPGGCGVCRRAPRHAIKLDAG